VRLSLLHKPRDSRVNWADRLIVNASDPLGIVITPFTYRCAIARPDSALAEQGVDWNFRSDRIDNSELFYRRQSAFPPLAIRLNGRHFLRNSDVPMIYKCSSNIAILFVSGQKHPAESEDADGVVAGESHERMGLLLWHKANFSAPALAFGVPESGTTHSTSVRFVAVRQGMCFLKSSFLRRAERRMYLDCHVSSYLSASNAGLLLPMHRLHRNYSRLFCNEIACQRARGYAPPSPCGPHTAVHRTTARLTALRVRESWS
jgi:hypothetical protein